MKEKESGITLLSLVITIIVMLILAGIALRLSIGDNGIIGITGNTIDLYQNASDQEGQGLNTFVDEFNQILNEDRPGGEDNTGDNITIADRPTISIIDWDNKGGIVQVSTQAGYTTQYRIGRTGPWKTYDGTAVNVDNGDTIYARYANDEGVSQTVSQIVEDTTPPTVTISSVTVDGAEISVVATASDDQMGMPDPITYNYYIRKEGASYFESVGHNNTGEFTFTGLEGKTPYEIRVSTTDLAGNQGSAVSKTETESVVEIPVLTPGQNIFFNLNPSTPTRGNVNVTIAASGLVEPLYLEYSVNGTDNWERYEGPVPMTDNGRVYARVTDGTEFSNVVYVDVTNIDRDAPDVSGKVTGSTSSTISVQVTPNDPSDPDINNFTYKYFIKDADAGDDQYKEFSGNGPTYTFTGLTQEHGYDIKIEVTDPAGNTTPIYLTNEQTGSVPSGLEEGNMTITSNPTIPTKDPVTVTITGKYMKDYRYNTQ